MLPMLVRWIGYGDILQILYHRAHHVLLMRFFVYLINIELWVLKQSLENVHNQLGIILVPEIQINRVYSVLGCAWIPRVRTRQTPFIWIPR
jgi:hypothetical protein